MRATTHHVSLSFKVLMILNDATRELKGWTDASDVSCYQVFKQDWILQDLWDEEKSKGHRNDCRGTII